MSALYQMIQPEILMLNSQKRYPQKAIWKGPLLLNMMLDTW